MSLIKYFVYLCLGYAAVWAAALTLIPFNDNSNSTPEVLILMTSVASILFYPPFAFGLLYNKQTGMKRWLITSGMAIISAIILVLWYMADRPRGLDGLSYIFASFIFSYVISHLTIGFASILQGQIKITRILGYFTLAGTFYSTTLLFMGMFKIIDSGIESIIVWLPTLATFIAAILSVLLTTFGSLKKPAATN